MKPLMIAGLAAAGLLAACGSDANSTNGVESPSRSNTSSHMTDTAPRAADNAREIDRPKGDEQARTRAETRILSILHAKNQEEIAIGRLAADKGVSQDVRDFGETLVRDHTENDTMVTRTADSENIALMQPDQINDLIAREKGQPSPEKGPLERLRQLSGSAFDTEFAQMMLNGHRDLIRMVEDAQSSVQNQQVRDLLDHSLPALRHHEQIAEGLVNR